MAILGVGIIGCGNISAAYLRLGSMFKGFEMRAVADIDPAAAAARADQFGVRADTVDGLLASGDIDVVVNLTVPSAHFDVTQSILRAGKHAYSEKPLGLSLAEVLSLKDLSAKTGLRVGSAPDTFLGGAHQHARFLIEQGAIGKVIAGSAAMMNHGMEHWHPNPDFFFQPGAGPMLDIGPYYIANLIQMLGPVKQVAALTSSASATRTIQSESRKGEQIPVNTPTNIHALLEFNQGATITLSTSWDVWAHRHPVMELYGTDGSLIVPDPNFFGGTVEIAGRDGKIAEAEAWEHPFKVPNEDHVRGRIANYRTVGLADMAAAIAENRPHRCALDLAIHVLDVMTSILRSGETGTFVKLSTTCAQPAALGPDAAQHFLKD